jgi:hypothetical protein
MACLVRSEKNGVYRSLTKPLLSGFAIQPHRFLIIPGYAFSVVIHPAQFVLRLGIPLISSFAIPLNGFLIVLRYAFAVGVHHAQVELSPWMAATRTHFSAFL